MGEVYVGISAKLDIETDFYISSEAVEADKRRPEWKRKYALFEASVNLQKVWLVKYDGKTYLTKSTHIEDSGIPLFIIDGPIPRLHSGKT